jgi:hypothetical protein
MSSQNCRNLGVSNFQDLTGTLGRGGRIPKWTKEISCLLVESMSLLSKKNGKICMEMDWTEDGENDPCNLVCWKLQERHVYDPSTLTWILNDELAGQKLEVLRAYRVPGNRKIRVGTRVPQHDGENEGERRLLITLAICISTRNCFPEGDNHSCECIKR